MRVPESGIVAHRVLGPGIVDIIRDRRSTDL